MNAIALPTLPTGRAVTPTTVWLNVNRVCNLRCGWCYAKGTEYRAEDEMSLDLAKRLLGMAHDVGVRSATLIGGEPTLWEPLFEFNAHAHSLDVRTTLVTNATRFGIDKFWAEYNEAPCSTIGLSIKAFDEKSFKCTTNTSAFETTRRGIQRVLSRKESRASVVYTGTNPTELVGLARFAAECGATSLGISPSTPTFVNGKVDLLNPPPHPSLFIKNFVEQYDELNAIFHGQISVATKYPLCLWPREFILKLIERNQVTTTCQLQHRTGLLFSPNGTAISCNSLHDYAIGQLDTDYSDGDSLARHLAGPEVSRFYDTISSYASTKCTSCKVKSYCGGGCPLNYGAFDAEKLIPGWDGPSPVLSMEAN
jgi:radical SAM protein with 4Fe4S-binding SPASM domain